MNQMRSSRRLEREAQRNLEVLWLIDRIQPSFKKIADSRRDHPDAIVATCREFVRFYRRQSLTMAILGVPSLVEAAAGAAWPALSPFFADRDFAGQNAAARTKFEPRVF